jgi:membrane protease YdiL (CAAX protease family)
MPSAPGGPLAPRTLTVEVWIVLWISIAASALRSLISLVSSLTSGESLRNQSASIIVSYAPDRPWLDLTWQLVSIALPLVVVLLVLYLLARSGESNRSIGLDLTEPASDAARGAVLAAVVGGAGLVLYLVAYHLGLSVRIAATAVEDHWWTLPILLLSALENALLEEVVMLGYLLHRLSQLSWKPWAAVGASALLRGCYHLYQGFGGFIGNLAMGLIFGTLFYRWRRTTPFVVAHFLIDAVAFAGYQYLHGKLSWLP